MGTTANNSWPYPESTDYVADGATAIENLADAIDSDLGDAFLRPRGVVVATAGGLAGRGMCYYGAIFSHPGGTLIDLAGMSITFTAEAQRIYKVTARINNGNAASSGLTTILYVRDGSTNLQAAVNEASSSLDAHDIQTTRFYYNLTPGSYTWKVSAYATSAINYFMASAPEYGIFMIEDVGGT